MLGARIPPESPRSPAPLAPHAAEDLKREPDGVPHTIIGMTVLLSGGLAIAIGGIFMMGTAGARIWAVVLGVVAVAVMTAALTRIARRDRDHDHPSR
jgi:hypothetical protein